MTNIVPADVIERRIYQLRGQRVMLDSDLATLYGVETSALVRQVNRNAERFPEDFAFRLAAEEWEALRCQIGISNDTSSEDGQAPKGRGGRRYLPYVFTEQGVAMLSGVLNSPQAIQVNIGIMRAFVRVREVLSANADLARRLETLEQRLQDHVGSTDQRFEALITVLRAWMEDDERPEFEPEPELPAKPIGFRPGEPGPRSKRAKSNG